MDGYGLSKIILIGEHSVVYGCQALAIPFSSLRTEVILIENEETWFDTKYYVGPLSTSAYELRGLKALVESLQATFPTITNVTISIRSNIPEKSGLGSSASVAKALIDAFNNHFKLGLSKDDYFNLLKISENIYHTKASGIDASTIIYESPIIYQKGSVLPLDLNIDGYLVAFYSHTSSATKDAVAHVSVHPQKEIHINKLQVLTTSALNALRTNNFDLLAKSFNSAHEELRALGVSSDTLELLRNEILHAGASAVKVTGGGMGGCLIALFDTKESAELASKRLEFYPSWMINLRHIS